MQVAFSSRSLSCRSLGSCRPVVRPFTAHQPVASPCVVRASEESTVKTDASQQGASSSSDGSPASNGSLERDLSRFTRQAAGTFAPRPSTASKNPAVKGSTLYQIFEVQAWIGLVAGGLLSFNIIFPTEQPDIPRLLGMWSIWMFTVPSLRAKECTPAEKDALNLLFAAIPVMNVAIPFVSKSFPIIFVLNTAALVGVYAWKGVWREIYGIPLGGMPKAYPAKTE